MKEEKKKKGENTDKQAEIQRRRQEGPLENK